MMTNEELQEALNWRKTDKLIDRMLSHIDDQAKQIDEQAEYIKELEEHADDHAAKYKTDMDDWRSQLATLKAALIKERLRDNYSCIKIDSYNPFRHHKEKLTPNEAKDQLAKEYPEILWEDQV